MERTRAFILSYRPYSDTSLLLHTVCEDGESRTFLIKGARNRKKDKVLHYKNPLAWLDVVHYPSKSGEIFLLKEAQLINVKLMQNPDPMVQCMRIFAADFLQHWVRQQPSFSEAYAMALFSDNFLTQGSAIMEFPLHLVCEAMLHMGLQPSGETAFLGNTKARHLWDTFKEHERGGFARIMLKNSVDRAQLLQSLLTYLSHSLPGFNKLKSIPVIKELL